MNRTQTNEQKIDWLPPLGYSPQFAAFNLIVLAVGHHALQHYFVLMVLYHATISHISARYRLYMARTTHRTSPI